MRRQGSRFRKAAHSLQIITPDSPSQRYDQVFISNYALVNILDELKRVPWGGGCDYFRCQRLFDAGVA